MMILNLFEVINRFKQQPEYDRKDDQVNDGECNIHFD